MDTTCWTTCILESTDEYKENTAACSVFLEQSAKMFENVASVLEPTLVDLSILNKIETTHFKNNKPAYLKSDDISQDSLINKSGKTLHVLSARAYSETSCWSFSSKSEFY